MAKKDWEAITATEPAWGVVVLTKIDDEHGARNEAPLKRGEGLLWWMPDGSMYVYYTPTHWKALSESPGPR